MRASTPHRLCHLLVLAASLLVGASGRLAAQEADTREELLRQQREAKATRLEPHVPGALERLTLKVENDRIIERWLAGSDGFFPRLATLTSGSGVAVGAGYKKSRLFDRQLDFAASAAVSYKKYWVIEAAGALPRLAGGRAFADFYARRKDFPQEPFFGLGPASRRDHEVDYSYREASAGGSSGLWILPWIAVGGGVDFLSPNVGKGESRRSQSIETRFGEADAPGLTLQPDFLRYRLFADINLRTPRGNPRAGAEYKVTLWRYDDLDLDRYGFLRFDVDVQQYFSFLQARRVVALHGLASLTDGAHGQQPPFYFQEPLGGAYTLRGFRTYRFRGENLLLLQAEYRWEIFPALDAALFYDAGKVAPRRADVNLRDLQANYGFGFRFGTIRGVFMRLDAAFGSTDGPHFFWVFNHVF